MKDKLTLKWIGQGVRGQGGKFAFVVVAVVLNAAITVLYALLVRDIVNEATAAGGSLARIGILAAVIAGAVLLQCALTLFTGLVRENLRARAEILFRKRAFDSVLRGDYAEISAYHSGDIQNRIFSDSAIVADGAARILPNLVSAASTLVFSAVTLFILQPAYTAILLCACVAAFFLAISFRKIIKRLHKRTREADGKSREIVFVRRIKTRHFSCFSTN